MNVPVSRRYQSVQLFIHYAHAIGLQTTTGNGIWTKLRLGTGIWYTPLQDHLTILLLSYISTRTVVQIVHLKSRLSLIVRVNVVLNRTVVVDSDWRFDNLSAVVIFRVKVSSITSVEGIILWLLIWLVYYVAMLLVVWRLSRDVIDYEDSYQ